MTAKGLRYGRIETQEKYYLTWKEESGTGILPVQHGQDAHATLSLLKADKKRSVEVFGRFIHTYKFDEAVKDGVVLDLQYEARDIDQDITSQEKIDQRFEAKTKGLTDLAKAQLRQRWGTLRKALSIWSRLQKIVADVVVQEGPARVPRAEREKPRPRFSGRPRTPGQIARSNYYSITIVHNIPGPARKMIPTAQSAQMTQHFPCP
jgi:SWI2/SNF2 ATPase